MRVIQVFSVVIFTSVDNETSSFVAMRIKVAKEGELRIYTTSETILLDMSLESANPDTLV